MDVASCQVSKLSPSCQASLRSCTKVKYISSPTPLLAGSRHRLSSTFCLVGLFLTRAALLMYSTYAFMAGYVQKENTKACFCRILLLRFLFAVIPMGWNFFSPGWRTTSVSINLMKVKQMGCVHTVSSITTLTIFQLSFAYFKLYPFRNGAWSVGIRERERNS